MTYFRYDNNRRGFDMAGIEWEIDELPEYQDIHYTTGGGGKWSITQTVQRVKDEEKYNTRISRAGNHVTTLGQQDTARFIRRIVEQNNSSTLRPRPAKIRSDIEVIESFLSAGDRV